MSVVHNALAVRPPAYAQLLVDSLDRYQNSAPPADASGVIVYPKSSSNWQLYLGNNVLNGLFTRLAVTQVNFQWNLPTIVNGYNNIFRVFVLGPPDVEYDIPLLEGYYTPSSLATQIQTALNAQAGAAGTWACTFTAGFVFNITLVPAGGVTGFLVNPGVQDGSSITTVVNRTRETLGFSGGQMAQSIPGLSQNGGIPTMLPTRFIDIVSNYLTKYQRAKDNTSLPSGRVTGVIARVYPQAPNTTTPLTASSSVGSQPFNVLIDYNTPKYIMWSPEEAIASIDFSLVDDLGLPLPSGVTPIGFLDRTCEYQLTILATEN
jgi:hypothetical protein